LAVIRNSRSKRQQSMLCGPHLLRHTALQRPPAIFHALHDGLDTGLRTFASHGRLRRVRARCLDEQIEEERYTVPDDWQVSCGAPLEIQNETASNIPRASRMSAKSTREHPRWRDDERAPAHFEQILEPVRTVRQPPHARRDTLAKSLEGAGQHGSRVCLDPPHA